MNTPSGIGARYSRSWSSDGRRRSGEGYLKQRLRRVPGSWAIARLGPRQSLPDWLESDVPFVSASWTDDELSLIAPERQVPADVPAERGFAAFRIDGIVPFSMTGVLARLSGVLAEAGISVFAVSTWDTDWFFVRSSDAEGAAEAWRSSGHPVEDLSDRRAAWTAVSGPETRGVDPEDADV